MNKLELDAFREGVWTSTGYCCRELLGFNYDEDEGGRHVNVGKGGIVDHGKHKEACDLLDNRSLYYKLIIMPRESRKSSILIGFCVRQVLLNPNIRICYIGQTDAVVKGKAMAIRACLARQEVADLFNEGASLIGDKWEETEFTVSSRTDHSLQNATFTAFSMDSFPVGGRFNIVICDDLIEAKNVATPEMNKKSKERFAQLQPFIARGGVLIVVGTIWDDEDLYNDLQVNKLFAPPLGGQIVCGAGVRVITDYQTGALDLEVVETGLTFPHLTREYLLQKLHGMALKGQYDQFVRQYLNEATSQSAAMFQRKYFQPLRWGPDMQALTGYLVTDTAYGEQDADCFSVVGYVGVDASHNIYLLDLRVGHWDPTEFSNQFFDVLDYWQQRVNHAGECWEKIALNVWAIDAIQKGSRDKKIRLNTIEMTRPSTSQKKARIMRLQPSMRLKRFFVCDTVPRTFTDLDGEKTLWDPEGVWDARLKEKVPGGELVDEFVKSSGKKDIADALAMILEYEKTKNGGMKQLCPYRPYRPKQPKRSLTEQRHEDYVRAEYQQPSTSGDWWESKLNDLRIY